MAPAIRLPVMAGLDPAIHSVRVCADGLVKPGHDELRT
jgi:hypothetical protein